MLLKRCGKPVLTAILTLLALNCAPRAEAKEYLLTGTKPDRLFLVDAKARKVEKRYIVPEAGDAIATIVPSPDGKRAYVLTNHMSSISGIDLENGKQVFRADFPEDNLNIKAFFAFDISPDGKEIFVYEMPTRLHPAEYEVLEPRIAVYNTDAGLQAKPVRVFPAPRRIHLLIMPKDGGALYALGFDLYKMNPKTGQIIDTIGVRNWQRPNYSIPDVLDFWPLWEQTGIFSTPYYTVRTDMPAGDPQAAKSGLMTLDLKTGETHFADFETTSVLMFSSVISPTRPNEVFAVYTQLSKIDREKNAVVKRVDLPHTYYVANISGDGNEVYLGGTMCDIGVYDHESLVRLGEIRLPGCGDMGLTSMRMIQR
jgi:quinohemoprotein amine dehydrogenase beta subunit